MKPKFKKQRIEVLAVASYKTDKKIKKKAMNDFYRLSKKFGLRYHSAKFGESGRFKNEEGEEEYYAKIYVIIDKTNKAIDDFYTFCAGSREESEIHSIKDLEMSEYYHRELEDNEYDDLDYYNVYHY